ncbi:hypothetical protein HU200_059341 [Digitaria exilis]|uniref:Uncharacterized protein n=1 Tax=Digitaria exilis TaxID=1010633 RepID=A0A835AH48_9POAL|nr:hypothetical protein HU200_059341 [Digitaria exilis]
MSPSSGVPGEMEHALVLLEQLAPPPQPDLGAPGFLVGMIKLLAATAVVGLAVALSFTQRLGIEFEMLFAIARSFVQLSLIGFVLQFIFSQKNATPWILLAYLFMVSKQSNYCCGDCTCSGCNATPGDTRAGEERARAIDGAKTGGLISLPGAMTGLIMAGVSPLEAIQVQIIVKNMLMTASTVSSILSSYLCWPAFFTKAFQLKDEVFAD